MLITDPVFYLVAIPAITLYGMGKGGLGVAAGAIAVPMMALVIDPVKAAAIMLPVICLMDAFAVKTFWKKFDMNSLKVVVPASVIGVFIGSLMLGVLSEDIIRVAIGFISVCFCLNYWFTSERLVRLTTTPWSGYFWGVTAGFTSTHIHSGGPPISIYLMAKNLEKFKLIGTMAAFFAVLNHIKLVPYSLLGQFDAQNLLMALVLSPLAPLGIYVGYFVLQKVPQEFLYKFLYAGLFLSGVMLLYDGTVAIV